MSSESPGAKLHYKTLENVQNKQTFYQGRWCCLQGAQTTTFCQNSVLMQTHYFSVSKIRGAGGRDIQYSVFKITTIPAH